MSGPASTDSLTYSASAGWLTTSLGSTPVATNAAMGNFVGQNEGPNGNLSGFQAAESMFLGVQMPTQPSSSQGANSFGAKNKLKCADKWQRGAGTSTLNLDANFFPVSWTPGGTIFCQFNANAMGNSANATGTWKVVYDDEYYASPSAAPGPTTVSLTDYSEWNLTLQSTSRVGTTITMVYTTSLSSGWASYYENMAFNVVAPSDGLWHISNPWVFAPGNTIDRSNPFDADDALVAKLTSPGGSVPACFRFMDSFNAPGGVSNVVDPSDIPPTSLFSWSLPYVGSTTPVVGNTYPGGGGTFQYARFYNTNASSETYAWSSPKLYSSCAWAVSGTDSFGQYLDLTHGPFGDQR